VLSLERSVKGSSSPRERDEERIPLRIDLDPAAVSEGCPKKTAMLSHDRGVALAELAKKLRRTLNVREDEGDRSTWKARHPSRVRRKDLNDDRRPEILTMEYLGRTPLDACHARRLPVPRDDLTLPGA
jgi:hypothetical protein